MCPTICPMSSDLVGPATYVQVMALSDLDRAVLRIEAQQWRYAGRKDAAIMALGLNATTYAAALLRLVQDPDAALEQPVLIKRIQRRIDKAMTQRRARGGSVPA